ncbi:MAG TPA: isoleucine--tRNA ligase [Candidatus Saccharimonadales bacterium]|nr:isoleucine--tRNA ligase [Candidatus Saccharimonadales bacterium]
MKFKANQRRKPIEYEKALIKYWRDHQIFEKSVQSRPASDSYVFYDGPPFITGVPHHGTLLSSIVKDAVPRYQTMKGKRVERVWGWDCHGLPAEVFTERKLGIVDKRDIGTKISLEDYIKTCRQNMVQTGSEWEDTIARIGRWVDFKGAYKTMDKPYMESVWWAFKKLYDDGKIYEGEKVLLYCTRDATPIAKAEVAMDNSYQDVTDPSVYVKFKLKNVSHESKPIYLLAWTTTPWTLPANTAVGVGKNQRYAQIELESGEVLILLNDLVAKVLTDDKHRLLSYKLIKSGITGDQLIGQEYEPLFVDRGQNAHKVWHYPGLSTEEGTGIVHLAPAYGEEDYQLAKEKDFPVVSLIDDNGFYTEGAWKGRLVWDVNKDIAKKLQEDGRVWKIEYITHSYPHCHRCGTRLMYRAHPSWFMDIDGQRETMLEENKNIYWFPEHFKNGRFSKNIVQAPDWNLSRDRFWATALPVWKGKDKNGHELVKVVGSYAELKELSGVELEDYHRPWIDEVTFEIDGVQYKRIDKVMDSWFEAGSMPFAQFHYPFENQQKFEQNFPGDFIAEYVGQVRAWFYYLHVVSIGLFGTNSFKNVIVTGTIAGNDGRKMSKNYGNYTDPNELMDRYSADALRFLFLSSPLLNGEDFSLKDKDVSDTARKLNMIWNMFDFFTLYAEVDGWQWDGKVEDPYQQLTHPLDQWVVSRAHQLTAEIESGMDRYDIPGALKGVLLFIDDASNWYIRRSRKRFWKSDNDMDKDEAYKTLHYVLIRLSLVLAPFTPFLAEELYQKLTGGESVHLSDWPPAGQVNGLVLKEMAEARELIAQGLAQRAEAGIKVRQPLKSAVVYSKAEFSPEILEIIKEELNVKAVKWLKLTTKALPKTELDLEISDDLKVEGLSRELIRHIQAARKKAGLSVDDRIQLVIKTESTGIQQAWDKFRTIIFAETLAVGELAGEADYSQTIKIDKESLSLSLAKVN